MSIILTEKTDEYKVKCGYCSKCYSYNEVWRKDKTSICAYCETKMYHIPIWTIYLVGFVLFNLFIIYL